MADFFLRMQSLVLPLPPDARQSMCHAPQSDNSLIIAPLINTEASTLPIRRRRHVSVRYILGDPLSRSRPG